MCVCVCTKEEEERRRRKGEGGNVLPSFFFLTLTQNMFSTFSYCVFLVIRDRTKSVQWWPTGCLRARRTPTCVAWMPKS